MKRSLSEADSSPEEQPHKHRKISASSSRNTRKETEVFDFPENQRFISALIRDHTSPRSTRELDTGYILGTVLHTWRDQGMEMRFVMRTEESEIGEEQARLEVVFAQGCADDLRERTIEFKPSSEVLLSLKGCTLTNIGNASNQCCATLRYSHKVTMKIIGRGEEQVVDLWAASLLSKKTPNDDSTWFDSPTKDRSTVNSFTQQLIDKHSLKENIANNNAQPVQKESSKQRKSKRRAREHQDKLARKSASVALAQCHTPPRTSSVTPASHATAQPSSSVVRSLNNTRPSSPTRATRSSVSTSSSNVIELDSETLCHGTILTTLSKCTTKNSLYSIAAVVVSSSGPSVTRTGDSSFVLELADPTIRQSALDNSVVKLNCFQSDEQLLPRAREGDIILLNNVKCASFNFSTNLVGYKEKLRWAVYGADGSLNHGDTPSELINNYRATDFSPFYSTADPKIFDYCRRLATWWLDLKNQKKSDPNVIQIQPLERRTKHARPHLSLADADPNILVKGFFDCTAEIVQTYAPSDGRYHVILITDYTTNSRFPERDKAAKPSGLSRAVLRVELWDAVQEMGAHLEVGAFYSFKNLKLGENSHGKYEAKMQEKKIYKLDREELGSMHQVLNQLLERRAKWAVKHEQEGVDKLKLKCFKDIVPNERFNCVLQILTVEEAENNAGTVIVHATDWTANEKLAAVNTSSHSDRPIVFKLRLRGSQAETARNLVSRNFYLFRKLIVKFLDKEFVGDLGGDEKLIEQLFRSLGSHKKLIDTLDRNKELLTGIKSEAPVSPSVQRSPGSAYPSIAQNLEGTFSFRARVIAVKPRELQDFIRRFCTRCNGYISQEAESCAGCEDIERDHVEFRYWFDLQVKDERSTVVLSIRDDSEFLESLPRADLYKDENALDELQQLMQSIAGNVIDYQADRFAGITTTELDSPYRLFSGDKLEEMGGKTRRKLQSWKSLDDDTV